MPSGSARAQAGKQSHTRPTKAGANTRRVAQFRAERRGQTLPETTNAQPGSGRPSLLLDHRRGWLLMEEMATVISMTGTDALAARAMGIAPATFKEWKFIGEQDLNALKDRDRETLEMACIMFMASKKEGQDQRPLRQLDEEIISRYAKFAALYRRAESVCITGGLGRLNVAASDPRLWQAQLAMFNRRFPDEYGEPERRIAGAGGGPIQHDVTGTVVQRVAIVTYRLPSNGYEPDADRRSEEDLDAEDDRAWKAELARRKRLGSGARSTPDKDQVVARQRPVAVVPPPVPTPPNLPDTPQRRTKKIVRPKLPPSQL